MARRFITLRAARNLGLLLSLCLHAAAAAAFFRHPVEPSDFAEEQGLAMTLELSPTPAAQSIADIGEQAPDVQEAAAAQGAPPMPALEEKLSTAAASDLPTAENTPYEAPPDSLARKETERRDETRPDEPDATNSSKPEETAPATVSATPSMSGAPLSRDDDVSAANKNGASIEARDTPDVWQSALFRHLAKHKRYPQMARVEKAEGIATIEFNVSSDGRVSQARLIASSGARLLDEEALAMLSRAQPLPKLPSEFRGRSVHVVLPVRYKLR